MTITFFLYYPLKDRLAVDLFRDLLIDSFQNTQIGPLTDYLTDDHPLPHFKIDCPESDIDALKMELTKVSSKFSIRIKTTPETWLGRQL